jgi:putative ABC transport system permease protein
MNWWQRLRKNDRLENQLDSELRYHLERQVSDKIKAGVPEEEARRAARIEFGGLDQLKEECRDARGTLWVEAILQDVRLAWRALHKSPGFAAAAICTLALGIGANTGIFSAVYSVLLKPLPYFQPERLYMAQIEIPKMKQAFGPNFAALTGRIQDYLKWRKDATAFSGVAAITEAQWNLTGDGEPERVGGAQVTTEFFSLLGVGLAYGPGFTPEEEQPGRNNVVVISDALWHKRYGGDPAIVGKNIEIDGKSHRVAGIAPASMLVPTGRLSYHNFAPRIDVWKPQAPEPSDLQGENWNQVLLLRLKPGENPEHGLAQLHALLNPPDSAQTGGLELVPRLVPVRDLYTGKIRLRLLLLMGASGLLLLVACVNVANLFLARLAGRSTEFATRIALGAGRARVVSHMLVESTVLAAIGGAAGCVIAFAALKLLIAYGPGDVPLLTGAGLNMPVLLFGVSMSMAAGMACGLFPAWQMFRKGSRVILIEGARNSLGGRGATNFRQILMGAEMALGTALLASAGLLLHSFVKVMGVDRGYAVDHVLAVDVQLSGERYSKSAQQLAFFRTLTENLRSAPGVLAAGAISEIPVSGDSDGQVILLDTDTNEQVTPRRPIAGFRQVTPGYFAASGSTLVAGRWFDEHDTVSTALISESLAERLWPGAAVANAVGRKIHQARLDLPLITILGVVRDVRPGAVEETMLPQIYRPFLPPRTYGTMTVVVRTSQEPATLAPMLRAQIRSLESSLPIPAIRTMQEMVSESVAARRFQMVLTALFAGVALLLGAVGIYGVVSYAVASRTREIGLRMALGAMRGEVMRWVFSKGLPPAVIGLVVGVCGAIAIATALRSLLFGITPTDPLSLVAVGVVLLLTSGVACYFPARRASRMDPVMALRHE